MSQNHFAFSHLETIVGQLVDLIPYTEEYVPIFNKWLQDPAMQHLVRTEAVSLEEEYKQQQVWAHSTDRMIKLIKAKDQNQVVGDIDFFFDGEGNAEVNIMVGDPEMRRHGYASHALTLAMQYAVQRFQVRCFVAKINHANQSSMKFFERHGFTTSDKNPNVFGEITYILDAGDLIQSDLQISSSFHVEV